MNFEKIVRNRKFLICTVCFLLFFLLLIVSNFLNFYNVDNVYSNDAGPGYLITRQYAESGNMFFEEDYVDFDKGNNLHSRGFITWNGKVVPFNFLGVPMFFSPFYKVFFDDVKIVNVIFLVLIVLYLYKLMSLYVEGEEVFLFVLLGVLFCFPILYYLNYFYMNSVPAATFFLMCVYYLLRFNQDWRLVDLFLAAFFCLISIWFRYDYALFFGLFFLVNFVLNFRDYMAIKGRGWILCGLFLMLVFVFLIPFFIFNERLYGSFYVFGYMIHNKVIFGAERSGTILNSVVNFFLPSQSLSLRILWVNVLNYIVFILPFFFVAAVLMIFKGFRKKEIWYLLVFGYVILYMGASNVVGSFYYTLASSIIRYWFLLYLFCILFVAYYLIEKKERAVVYFVVACLLVISFARLSEEGYKSEISTIDYYGRQLDETAGFKDEIDYLITPVEDKYYVRNFKIISWWGGIKNTGFDSRLRYDDLVGLIGVLLENNESVFLLYNGLFSNEINKLKRDFKFVDESEMFEGLYRLK